MNNNLLKNQNLISRKKKPYVILMTFLFISSILMMDVSHVFVQGDINDQYTFFYDDFMNTTVNSTKIWSGTYEIKYGQMYIDEGKSVWSDCNIMGWSGYTDLFLKINIEPFSSSSSSRILIRDANTSEILYSSHPTTIDSDTINLLPYVDLTSSHLKIEVIGFVKFDDIKIYTPNLFITNLLLDENVESALTSEVSEYTKLEDNQEGRFRSYSRQVTFNPDEGTRQYYIETRDYFIPYLDDLSLIGQMGRSKIEFEDENAFNATARFVLKAKYHHGRSVEYKKLVDITEYLDGRVSSIYIPLDSLKGKDVSFVIYMTAFSWYETPSPILILSYLGITAKANPKLNGREIDAMDYATKDVYTQVTPAVVSNDNKLVLARDREGTIATYRTFLGTNSSYVSCSNYVLSDYLDEPSDALGSWKSDDTGESLTFDIKEESKGVVAVDTNQFKFSTGTLETYFSVYEYGLAAGVVYKYLNRDEFWAIAVQKMKNSDDLALLIHNYAIVDSIPLINNIQSDVSIRIIKNAFLDSYRIYVNDQLTFIRSHNTISSQVGFFYRVVENTDFGGYYPAQFYSLNLYNVGEYDVSRMYLTVQNPTYEDIIINVQEIYSSSDFLVHERRLATFTIPHTNGFETFLASCLMPSYHTKLKLEMEQDSLVYVTEFGFLGFSTFGSSRDANLYYNIDDSILFDSTGRRVLADSVLLETQSEWVSYDMQIKEGYIYVYANTTSNDNLEFNVSIRPINSSFLDPFIDIGTIYFIEKDGKEYGHNLFINQTIIDSNPAILDIYEVKLNFISDIDFTNPVNLNSIATRAVSDKVMGEDYSSINDDTVGWREEWEIDSSETSYIDQKAWYTDIAFSSLNGGPSTSWVNENNISVVESPYYTTVSSSDVLTERFLGDSINVINFPFLEFKLRSVNMTELSTITIGIHTVYGSINTSLAITDYWLYHRLNIYQMAVSLYKELFPENDPSLLEQLLIDKIFVYFNTGELDICAIRIYRISNWDYVPGSSDDFFTTAHLEGEQDTIFQLGSNSSLSYTVAVEDWVEFNGNWSFELNFMLIDIEEQTVLFSLMDENNNKFTDTIFVDNGCLYIEDFNNQIHSLNLFVERYRWHTLSIYSNEYSNPLEYNYTVYLDDQSSSSYYTSTSSGESLVLGIITTQTEVYLKKLSCSSLDLFQNFDESFHFIISDESLALEKQWIVLSDSDLTSSHLTKINLGEGGTIASSSSYLVLDQNIKLEYKLNDLSFSSPVDFYFWITMNVYAQNLQTLIDDDFVLTGDMNVGVENQLDYKITIDDIGEYLSSIQLISYSDFSYVGSFSLWGNCSLSDYYTDFSDGQSVLSDWSTPTDGAMITNTGDLSSTINHPIDEYSIFYYNQIYSDFILTADVNSSSIHHATPLGGGEDQFYLGLVFLAQQKTLHSFTGFSGYFLALNATSGSGVLSVYRYDDGIATFLEDYSGLVDLSKDFNFGISVTAYSSYILMELILADQVLGSILDYTTTYSIGGYTGTAYYRNMDGLYGVINSYGVYHKYYYPTSDHLQFDTSSKDNAFVAGKLHVDSGSLQTDILDFTEQQTLTLVFTFEQWNPHIFIGLSTAAYNYGFRFYMGNVYKRTNSVDELLEDDWCKKNIGRTMYITIVYGLSDGSFNMQLFTDKSFRPVEGDPLYISFNPSFTEPIFEVSNLSTYRADLIVEAVELGGVYPIDVEFDDGSSTHTLRGSGEIAEYYLQATSQGSLKLNSLIEPIFMKRQFYVLDGQNTTIALSYLSPGYHAESYSILIYNQEGVYLNISFSSGSNNCEEITVYYNNTVVMEELFSYSVPYYQWIDLSLTISPLLQVSFQVSHRGGSFSDSSSLSYYLDVDSYYNIKIIKPQSSADYSLYFSYISVYNGAGFSSSFTSGDLSEWIFSDKQYFEYSHDISTSPDLLSLYAEPLGGWADFTVSVDDGAYVRTTRLQVEDFETFKPYLIFLPNRVDTTEIHKYTIIVNGILTIYSLSFQESLLISDWLVAKPLDINNEEILNDFTQIGYLLEDFETDTFSNIDVVSDPTSTLGNVGKIIGEETLSLGSYIGGLCQNDLDLSLYYYWNGLGTHYPFELEYIVTNEYLVPSDQVEERTIRAIITPVIADEPNQPLFDACYTDGSNSSISYVHFKFSYVPNTWQFVYLNLASITAYSEQETTNPEEISGQWQLRWFEDIIFNNPQNGAEVYIDDIQAFNIYNEEREVSPFARAYLRTSSLNYGTEGIWVPEYVNSLGFLDFSLISNNETTLATEQAAFIVECDKEADVVVHVTSTHPFILYQGQVIMEHGTWISPNDPVDYYFTLHVFEGVNRFLIRTFHKQNGLFPWQIKVDFLTQTSVRMISSTYEARDESKVFDNSYEYSIADWLVSDRPVSFGDLDYVSYDKDPFVELDENTGHYFATRSLPYPDEQFNYTIHLDQYDKDITEWVGFDEFYNETGYMSYIDSNMNTTSIEFTDQIIYYTNLHFLESSPNDNTLKILLNYDPTSLVEAMYFDGQYIYGRLGEIGYLNSTSDFVNYISVTEFNGAYILEIPLSDAWETFGYDFEWQNWIHSRFDVEPEAGKIDISGRNNPSSAGVHRFSLVLRCPDNLDYISSDIFDIQANLTKYDDSINTFNQITEYISTKQSLSELSPLLQTDGDYRSLPSSGLQSGKQSYAGKKVLESEVSWDGFRYHTMRFVLIGVDQYGKYENMNGDETIDEKDATGLATYMIVNDAGTKHEHTSIVQHMIGPEGQSGDLQPTLLCPRYTMTAFATDSLLFSTSHLKLSQTSASNSSISPLSLELLLSEGKLTSFNIGSISLKDDTYKQSLSTFLASAESDIYISFSLSNEIRFTSGNETISLDIEYISLVVGEYRVDFSKYLQKLSISYSDNRNLEVIEIHLLSRVITHTDPIALHKSYHKIGQVNGFAIYDYNKILAISEGKLSPPQQVSLGLFDTLATYLTKIKGGFLTVIDGVNNVLDSFTVRYPGLNSRINSWFENLQDSVQNTLSYIGNVVTQTVERILTIFNDVVNIITNSLIDTMQGIIDWCIQLFKDAIIAYQILTNAVKNFLAKATAWISEAWDKVSEFFKMIGQAITDFFKMLGQIALKIIKGVASFYADLMRVGILFIFSILFGTNVGLHDTQDLMYVDGTYVFDNQTVTNYPQVYKLDHVIDVLAGRTDLEGELTEEELAEIAENSLNQGQGDNANPDQAERMLAEMGCETQGLTEKEKDFFDVFKWVCAVEDGGQWDYYFGLRKHLRLYGLNLFSENTFILICEIVIGFLPLGGLIQDVKDVCLEPMKFFRIFAGVMIPLDITELFGNVLSQVFGGLKDSCAGKGIGKALGGIKEFIKTIFGKVAKKLKEPLKRILKVAKNASLFFVALLCMVTIILIPMSALVFVGLAAAFLVIIGFIIFIVAAFKFLMKRIMKPLFEQMFRGLSWLISKTGDGIKKLFTMADELAKGLLTRIKNKIADIFSVLWKKIKGLWEFGNWKPWKDTRMPWCVACYSNLAKRNINDVFEVIKNGDEVWATIKNLDPSSWDAIKHGADFGFPEDILKMDAIEETARLISPGKSVDELFEEGGEWTTNAKFRERWLDASNAFYKSYKETIGNLVAKTTIKQNLIDLQRTLPKNNFIDQALQNAEINSIDDLVNDPDALNAVFKNSQNLEGLWKFYLEQANTKLANLKISDPELAKCITELTEEEAQAYAKTLLVLCGANSDLMTQPPGPKVANAYAEPFQRAWIKLRIDEDEIRNIMYTDKFDEILSIGNPGKYEKGVNLNNGFDDILIGKTADNAYYLSFIEQKTNSIKMVWLRDGKGTEASQKIFLNAKESIDDIESKLITLGFSKKEAEQIIDNLLSRARGSPPNIGIDFLRKVSNGDLLETLKKVEPALDQNTINEIMEAAIKQNQIISLIETGSTFKMAFDENGFLTVLKNQEEHVTNIIDLKYINKQNNIVDIKFDGSIFKIDIDCNTNKLVIPEFPGNNINLDSLTTAEKNAYVEINQLIQDSVSNIELSIIGLTPNEIAGRVNQMQKAIYDKFICNNLFKELQILSEGSVDFSLETLSNPSYAALIANRLESFCDTHSIVTYNRHQQWTVPFGQRFSEVFGGYRTESEIQRTLKEKLMRSALLNSDYDVSDMSLDDLECLFESDPELWNVIMRNYSPDTSTPSGPFFRRTSGGRKKTLYPYDKSGNPLLKDGKEIYFEFDLDSIINKLNSEHQINDMLLKNPVKFHYVDGHLFADFNYNRIDGLAESWVDFLRKKYSGIIPDEQFEQLLSRSNLEHCWGVNLFDFENSEDMFLFIIILEEYKNNWDEFARIIDDGIANGFIDLANDIDVSVRSTGSGFVNIDGEEYTLRMLSSGNDRMNWNKYEIPCAKSGFERLLNDIKQQVYVTVLGFPEDVTAKSFLDWITANWHFL